MHATPLSTVSVLQQRTRYLRRRDPPRQLNPLWWALPLLVIALAIFCGLFSIAPAIERATATGAQAALVAAGFRDLRVTVDGQAVVVYGTRAATDKLAIETLVSHARCATWLFGPQTCPTEVTVQLADTPAQGNFEPVPTDAPRYHDLTFRRTADSARVAGWVPSEQKRGQLLKRIRASLPEVQEAVQVSGESGSWLDAIAIEHALRLLDQLQRGVISWRRGQFSAAGEVTATREAAARAIIARVKQDLPTTHLQLRLVAPQRGQITVTAAPTTSGIGRDEAIP